jgi:hypothetical protein
MATDNIIKHFDTIFCEMADIRNELNSRFKASETMVNFNSRLSSISVDKTQEEEFYSKIEFLAKLFHFKKRYDDEYKPDWFNINEPKYYIAYNPHIHNYYYGVTYEYPHIADVYFSSSEMASKCIKWLNKFN